MCEIRDKPIRDGRGPPVHTKIDNWSAKSVHYNEKFHYYGVHYYERRLYIQTIFFISNYLKFEKNLTCKGGTAGPGKNI